MSRFFSKKKGAATNDDDDANRNNLFGNRTAQKPPPNSNNGDYAVGNPYAPQRGGYDATPPPSYSSRADNRYGGPPTAIQNPFAPQRGGDDGRSRQYPDYGHRQQQQYQEQSGGYGQPGAVQQSEEYDSEEAEVKATKTLIEEKKKKTLYTTERSIATAKDTIDTGMRILGHLGTQGESLANVRENLGKASRQGDRAAEQTRELESLNASMLRIHIKNPMRSASRAEEEEARILAYNQLEREERDRTREFSYDSKNVVGRAFNPTTGRVESKAKSSPAERSRYQCEADSEDDALEDKIDANLDQLGALTGQLKGMAMATGKEVDRQNQQIDRIMKKTDRVDDQIALNSNRLRKIH
ncbi:hypothetical protein L873DRAFT_1407359 [Choiromyces venosus 120613-1]|uniref:t-SNARE coiled-coil homology domain-containing protein n=1 Tax=Choiromyces venosus 120613-1 TaxID=1336337 RepID=A0A3N4J930_9PEZI|nr:hypothetical protein L873DRAFT_1407359 [Choiromyces venosus 120613-1]